MRWPALIAILASTLSSIGETAYASDDITPVPQSEGLLKGRKDGNTDCSQYNVINKNGWVDVVNLGYALLYKEMSCLDMTALALKSTDNRFCAAAVVDKYTIFSGCRVVDRNIAIAVKGGQFREGQLLPPGDYSYLGIEAFQKANGFTVNLPVIESK